MTGLRGYRGISSRSAMCLSNMFLSAWILCFMRAGYVYVPREGTRPLVVEFISSLIPALMLFVGSEVRLDDSYLGLD